MNLVCNKITKLTQSGFYINKIIQSQIPYFHVSRKSHKQKKMRRRRKL